MKWNKHTSRCHISNGTLGVIVLSICSLFVWACGAPITVEPLTLEEVPQIESLGNYPDKEEYRIEPGDTLRVRYPFHSEKNQEDVVRPDGRLATTVVGDLHVAGMKASELRQFLVENISDRLRDPEVVVAITAYAPRSVYVAGEVSKPGPVSYRRGLTPLQAVVSAGGFRDTAFAKSVVLIRATGPDVNDFVARKLDLEAVIRNGVEEPLSLAPHDVIFVPRTGVAEANLWVKQHITEMVPFFRGTGMSYGIAQ
jgi:protein involved in polysaccharide export with SLBB domain